MIFHLHAPGVQVAGEGVPERVQATVLNPRRHAGLLHRRQQVPVAQVLAGLRGEYERAADDPLCLEVPDGLHRPAVERDRGSSRPPAPCSY